MKYRISLILILISLLTAAPASAWQAKVDPWVLQTAETGETEFLVYLSEQADLSGVMTLPTKAEKGAYVYRTLSETAARSQAPLIAALKAMGVDYRPYWIANMIWVRGDEAALQSLALRADVAHLYANPSVQLEAPAQLPEQPVQASSPQAADTVGWNVQKINADDVWGYGYTGQGAVIGGQDTGYDWDHPALINKYRGWNGSSADHNYNWHDAIHADNPNSLGTNVCGFNSPVPCDDQQHGTHTMGTMVGDDGLGNQIGVAPGARWIGCRNMENNWGTPATYSECYQWFIAPTDLNGQNPRPDLAPDVINNSWSCPVSEGCTDPNVLLTVVNNVRAAGILTVHSAGNSGSGCTSISTPAAIYDASFTIGATNSSDTLSGFSSRGPVSVDGSNRMKPDVSAPGEGIRSSLPGGGYSGATWSGTSMAAPHVAGLVALLISVNPGLRGNVDSLEDLIRSTAVGVNVSPAQTCGGIPSTQIPNNSFGWGRVDALAAAQALPHYLALNKTPSSDWVQPGQTLTYTLDLTHQTLNEIATNAILTDTLPVGTTFISATPPYTFNGSIIHWELGSLDANETVRVTLAVQAPVELGVIANDTYTARIQQLAAPVTGIPVYTDVRLVQYLPVMAR